MSIDNQNNQKRKNIIIKCYKCNNIVNIVNVEIDLEHSYVCNNCGNLINLSEIYSESEGKDVENENINENINKIDNNIDKIKFDISKKNDYMYKANIIIKENIPQIILLSFVFSSEYIFKILFIITLSYLVYWIYKYMELGVFLNQVLVFLFLSIVLIIIISFLGILYNSFLYNFVKKLFLVNLSFKNLNKKELKIFEKPILNLEYFLELLKTGSSKIILNLRTNLKRFILANVFFLIAIIIFFGVFLSSFFWYGFDTPFYALLYCYVLLFLLFILFTVLFLRETYLKTMKYLLFIFDYWYSIKYDKQIDYRILDILLKEFINIRKLLSNYNTVLFLFFFQEIIRVSLILSVVGILFLRLPDILMEFYSLSYLVNIIISKEEKLKNLVKY